MGSFFNMDNPIFTFMSKVFDVLVLSFIYILCCIPIITIGTATTACYYTMVKVIRKNRGYVAKEFFSSFKENFKVGTITWIIVLLASFLLYFNVQISKQINGTLGGVLPYVYMAAIIFLTCIGIYLFPVLSRFRVGTIQLIKMCFFLAMKHLPTTFGLLIMLAGISLGFYITLILIPLIVPIYLLASSFLMERVLKKYITKQEETEPAEDRVDQWYFD